MYPKMMRKLFENEGAGPLLRKDILPTGVAVDVATVDAAGIVRPDGTTIEVDGDGVISLAKVVTLSDAVDSDSSETAASSRAAKTAHTAATAAHAAALLTETAVDLGDLPAGTVLDGTRGRAFSGTVTAATTVNAANVEPGVCLLLILKNGGAHAVTWGMAPRWPGGKAPVLQTGGEDVVALLQSTGGVWYGVHVAAGCA